MEKLPRGRCTKEFRDQAVQLGPGREINVEGGGEAAFAVLEDPAALGGGSRATEWGYGQQVEKISPFRDPRVTLFGCGSGLTGTKHPHGSR